MVLTLIILIPLSFIKNMKKFAIPSLIADVAIMSGLICILYYSFTFKPPKDNIIDNFNINNIPLFYGISSFIFEGVGVILIIQKSMRNPEKYLTILRRSMSF